jgi:hypothetical protein
MDSKAIIKKVLNLLGSWSVSLIFFSLCLAYY